MREASDTEIDQDIICPLKDALFSKILLRIRSYDPISKKSYAEETLTVISCEEANNKREESAHDQGDPHQIGLTFIPD